MSQNGPIKLVECCKVAGLTQNLPRSPHKNPSDIIDVTTASSVIFFTDSLSSQFLNRIEYPPTSYAESKLVLEKGQRYIWIMDDRGIVIVNEKDKSIISNYELARGDVSHTNLTGGGPAMCGGEVYFTTDNRIFATGGSGRYPPSHENIISLRMCLSSFGCEVILASYEEGNDVSLRVFPRGL